VVFSISGGPHADICCMHVHVRRCFCPRYFSYRTECLSCKSQVCADWYIAESSVTVSSTADWDRVVLDNARSGSIEGSLMFQIKPVRSGRLDHFGFCSLRSCDLSASIYSAMKPWFGCSLELRCISRHAASDPSSFTASDRGM